MSRVITSTNTWLLGSFQHVDALEDAIRESKRKRVTIKDVFSPVPVDGAIDLVSPSPSPVKFSTFVGGLSGLVGGLALGILTALIWNIHVAGKPVASHVPFVVVAFEGMILLGALFTFFALMFHGRLPFTKFPGPAYREEFSLDKFGLWISCSEKQIEEVSRMLKKAGALSVERVDKGDAR